MRLSFQSLFRFLELKRHFVLSLLIISGSIAVSAYLIFDPKPTTDPQKPLVEVENKKSLAESLPQSLNFTKKSFPNLTAEFTDLALKKVIADNEVLKAAGAKQISDFYLLPTKNDVNEIVSKIIDNELSSEQIKISDLNVNSSNTKDTQLAYLLFIEHLLETQNAGMPDLLNTSSMSDYFNIIADEFERTAEILKIVNAPPSWLEIHRDLITFFLRQRNIYRSFAAANTDPLRFLVAAARFTPLEVEKEFQKIKAAINRKVTDEKLI